MIYNKYYKINWLQVLSWSAILDISNVPEVSTFFCTKKLFVNSSLKCVFFSQHSTLSFSVDFSGFNQGYGSEGGVDPDPNPTHEKQHGSDLKKISRYHVFLSI